MNKPRKHNGAYKLQIHKHTKVRRPVSSWHISLVNGEKYIHYFTKDRFEALHQDAFHRPKPIPVQDISMGLENPLNTVKLYEKLMNEYMLKQKVDWNKDMEELFYDNMKSVKEEDFGGLFDDKPSLLTRVKERFKR